ncbi:MAG: YIP1 family protein [Burkholderiales bacterium]|nr:YIP1 family protein [Burkholderiales bacterium]
MNATLIDRVRDILLKPRDTWPVIDAEPADVAGLYTRYYMILAAIPAVCGFIGLSVIGVGGFFGSSFRLPLVAGLVHMVGSYVVSLVLVYLLALVIDALAPTFGGVKSPIQALKVAVYGSTASLVGGVFSLLPSLSMLGLLVALYSIYLLYTGLPVLMKSPREKAIPYTAVVVIAAIVLGAALGWVVSLATPMMSMVPSSMGRAESPAEPPVAVPAPTPEAEAARRAGEAASKALGTATGAVAGTTGTVPVQSLRAAVPETLGGLPRTALEVSDGAALGIAMAQATAEYRQGDAHARLSIVDAAGLGQLAQLAATMQSERETETHVEKNRKEGDRVVQENYAKDGSTGEYKVVLKNGVIVGVQVERLSIDEMKKAVNQIDLNTLEGLQRAAR